jgi:hypothetical protein
MPYKSQPKFFNCSLKFITMYLINKKNIRIQLILFFLIFHLTSFTQQIVYPSDLKTVVDVTKPPYNCDNSGMNDCTAALIRAMDDLVRPARDGQRAIEKELAAMTLEEYVHPSSVENRIRAGQWQAIFPAELAPAKILYFPKGIYRVSNTISYTFDDLHNSRANELNRQIIIRGQNQKETVIKLTDNSPGFEKGSNKPVVSYMLKERSNVAMANMFEDITIDVGTGNEGAAGLRFYGNNMAAVKNVTITSSDPEKGGAVGLLLDKQNISGVLIKNLTVDGFDYGVQVWPNRIYCVFEHIHLSNQKVTGFLVNELLVSIRGLVSTNECSALKITGNAAHVTLIDSDLRGVDKSGSNSQYSAIEHTNGVLFARNVTTAGYGLSVSKFGKKVLPPGYIDEYSSHGVYTLFGNSDQKSLNLPIEETPEIPWNEDLSKWASVNQFGAKGDGVTDDTKAIQKALNSGIPNVYFQPGKYLLNAQITVPAKVQRINFMFADLAAGEKLQAMDNQGTFKINENAVSPLIFEDLFAFEAYKGQQYFIDHASTRTLVMSDMHIQIGAIYTNSVSGGKVFIENVACTDQFQPNPNCFSFTGQQVWARQFNPERADPQAINDGGSLWVFGVKLESGGVGFLSKNNSYTEVLGGTTNMGQTNAVVNDNSNVSIVIGSSGWKPGNQPVVAEIRNGVEKTILRNMLPKRVKFTSENFSYNEQFFVPLYVGKK